MTWATFADYCASGVTVPLSMSRSHFGAYRKGVAARDAGQPPSTCPYCDGGTSASRGKRRAYLYAWMTGWQDRDKEVRDG